MARFIEFTYVHGYTVGINPEQVASFYPSVYTHRAQPDQPTKETNCTQIVLVGGTRHPVIEGYDVVSKALTMGGGVYPAELYASKDAPK